ncbi:MAG: glycosyltransferase family 9 protein [Calditrichota bacterium]
MDVKSTVFKILIIRFSSLGDVLLATPLLGQLRRKFPQAQIDFLVRSDFAEVLRYNPNLSNLIEFKTSSEFNYLRYIRRRIHREGYDVILDIHRNLRSRFICLGISTFHFRRTRVLKVRKNQIIRFLLVKFKINLYQKLYGRIIPVWEKYLRTAAPLGITPINEGLQFFLPKDIDQKVDSFLQDLPAGFGKIVMAPGARHFTKRWPPEYYQELIRMLFSEKGWRTILIGGKDDTDIIHKILSGLPEGIAVSASGKLCLAETAGLIRRTALMVSNDSGLMHVGSAMNVRLVAIFGSTVQELGFFPWSLWAIVLENRGLYCRPCSHIGRATCPEKHFRCMTEIQPQKVLQTIFSFRDETQYEAST